MTDSARQGLASTIRRLAPAGAVVSIGIGMLVLLGWTLGVAPLQAVAPGLPSMAPNAAVGFVLLGVALLLTREDVARRWRRVARTCAALAVTVGVVTIGEHAVGVDLGIHQFLFDGAPLLPTATSGRTAPTSGLCLVLLGSALLLIDVEVRPGLWPSEILASTAFLTALVALNGYAHGAVNLGDFHGSLPDTGLALHSALLFCVVSGAVLCARPHRGVMVPQLSSDTIGGELARRLLPAGLLLPLLLGLLLDLGRRGQVYSAVGESALFSTLMTSGGLLVFILSAAWLDRLESARRRAVAALEQSQERFRGLLESAPDAVISADKQGVIVLVNAQAERLFGYTRAELLGQAVEVLLPEASRERHAEHRSAHMANTNRRTMACGTNLCAVRKDGSRVPVEVTLSGLATEDGMVLTAIIHDVTERRRAEEEREQLLAREREAHAAVEAERALLQTVLDSVPVGILFVDGLNGRTLPNRALRELLGHTGEAGETVRVLERLRRPDGRMVDADDLPSARALKGQVTRAEEYLLVRTDGRRIPLLANAAPVHGTHGEVRAVIVALQDISARRDLERLREEYVGLISHDLGNPLGSITLCAQALQRSLRKRDQPEDLRNADAILQNAQRMKAMIQELLEVARLESGHADLRKDVTDVARLLTEVVERAVPLPEASRMHVELAEPLLPVPADQGRLERVVVNLITNALKYAPAGTPVTLRASRANGQVVVSVEDQGPGIHPEDTPHIFEKYYRTHSAKKADGLGLGLYICRLITEAHGGRIWVDTTPGRGSTFYFSLPGASPGLEG